METERLILRQFERTDREACFENFGQDAEIGRYIPIFPVHTLQEMESVLQPFYDNQNIWVIIEKATGSPIGYVTADIPYESLGIAEIGYVLGSRFQHKGYAEEAVRRIIQYLFAEKGLYLIEAKVNEQNTASVRFLERLGFQREASLRGRRVDFASGVRNNLLIYSVLAEEYLSRTQKGAWM